MVSTYNFLRSTSMRKQFVLCSIIFKLLLFKNRFLPKNHSAVIADTSLTGIVAVLGGCGRYVTCIPRRLSKAKHGYSDIRRAALAMYLAVERLHKFLFGPSFIIATGHEAIRTTE
ncbi:uncharacterized protein DEA37_0014592 [Paragonimus westermani]|uniref:Reverse transcriptase RNase H-like domain-containing protein n=1 Tax=Paragonimus westermani TaxID=34504 RepID=A0A5J4NLK8_9TREM|nr:uncharacterized protein DEA37_0014592 [Paragonimus westermani]